MKIVSEMPEEEIRRLELERKKKDAENDACWAMRALAANILRIVRGAGKDYDLVRQLIDCQKTFQAYYDLHGFYPTLHANKWLDPDLAWHEFRPWIMEGRERKSPTAREYAEMAVRRGALQMVASMLKNDATHHSTGRYEMHDGVRAWEEANRKEIERERRNPTTMDDVLKLLGEPTKAKRKKRPT